MKLRFVTSISKNYWNETAKYCIPTWNLPGEVTVYIDQSAGDIDWITDVPFHKELVSVSPLPHRHAERTKIRKFWGKSFCQIDAVRNRSIDERIIWIDADVEQIAECKAADFTFDFTEPFAIMNSADQEDCWETGLVIFNQQFRKLNMAIRRYENVWKDEEELFGLFRPYDAFVLGLVAEEKGYLNLCKTTCDNEFALDNSRYGKIFKHWINKDNKKLLQETKK